MKLTLPGILICSVFFESVAETPQTRLQDLKPLPAGETQLSAHTPFASGECDFCHERNDPKNPGPVSQVGNTLCLSCHDEFQEVMARKFMHAAMTNCLSCHNPHNAKQAKLVTEKTTGLCLSCHEPLKALLELPVQHGALQEKAGCVGCHDPHAAKIERLLLQPAMSLCLSCHDRDDVTDDTGKKLTNVQQFLADNPQHHWPVDAGECSACHNPHASRIYRLLTQEYPQELYAPYEPRRYALCFDCHEDGAFASPEAGTATRFRDGNRNLHYLHVNKDEFGRTCRVCHEVHASKHPLQIRERVPYGASGWALKINYSPTPTGGTCVRTCHAIGSYTNTPIRPSPREEKAP